MLIEFLVCFIAGIGAGLGTGFAGMSAAVLAFTLVGSWVASIVPNTTMGGFSTFMTLLLGIKFIVKPVMTTKDTMQAVDPKKRIVQNPSSAAWSSWR